ncbi:MAG: PorP/SprF family type IX secretion system membrane protein [Bacteroidales bacterium]
MRRCLFFLSFLCLYSFYSEAQDIHFTQYYTSPLNLNPGMTGFFDGTQRYTFQNKTQWESVTVPFTTLSASCDMPILKRYLKHDLFGGGIVIYRDQEGDSKYGTTQVNLSLSYIRSVSTLNNQFVSFGLQAGAAQRTIDYSQLIFDDQWDGTSFNPALSNNEQFATRNFFFFDLSAGSYWSIIQHNGNQFSAGVSLFHINKPRQSLFGNNDVRLARKPLINGNALLMVTDKIKLCPGILIMHQETYNEIDIGSLVKYIVVPAEVNYLALSFGLYYRVGDAFNLIAGLDYHDFALGVSYDINSSNLVPASHYRGGFELTLMYIVNKNKKNYVKKIPCPIF